VNVWQLSYFGEQKTSDEVEGSAVMSKSWYWTSIITASC